MLWPKTSDAFSPLWAAWWRSLDRWILFSIFALIAIGTWLIVAASPAVTAQHHWSPFFLLKKHLFFLAPGMALLLMMSFLGKNSHLKSAYAVTVLSLMGMWFVLWMGPEIKGARRWLSFGFFSIQPSEFFKPAMVIITAHLLSIKNLYHTSWKFGLTLFIMGFSCLPLLLQPDLGMIFLLASIWFCQCFFAGFSWRWIVGIGISACCCMVTMYYCFSHAAGRIHAFFSKGQADLFGSQYQIIRAFKGFSSGGLWGKGPGAGTFLDTLPDGHAEFIFAVAGEEMGLVACLFILGLYAVIVGRGLYTVFQEYDLFYRLAILGLIMQFVLQMAFNIGSVLGLIPTKGMTLPFLSYGGSSFISLCWAMGMLLGFTRRYHPL